MLSAEDDASLRPQQSDESWVPDTDFIVSDGGYATFYWSYFAQPDTSIVPLWVIFVVHV